MKQLGISVEVKFTKALDDGSFRSVKVGTEAQLEETDDPSAARRDLYFQVREDLKACWKNHKRLRPGADGWGDSATDDPAPPIDYPEAPIPKGTKTGKPRKKKGNPGEKGNGQNPGPKICPIHNLPMKRWTNNNGGAWYSHLVDPGDGSEPYWCNGKARKGKKR